MSNYFDATQFAPEQGGDKHPVGKFPAYISTTDIKPTNKGDGHYLELEFTTPQGKIAKRFNLWNNNADAVRIANGQLSAVCHATGVYRLNYENKAGELLNKTCQIEVRQQKNNTDFNEVGKVFDANGNEPGKAPPPPVVQPAAQQQPPAPQPQPQPTGSPWNTATAQPAAQPTPQPQAPAPQANPAPWTPGGATETKAPWQR